MSAPAGAKIYYTLDGSDSRLPDRPTRNPATALEVFAGHTYLTLQYTGPIRRERSLPHTRGFQRPHRLKQRSRESHEPNRAHDQPGRLRELENPR